MRIDVMTLFPEFVDCVLSESIIGRARKSGALDVRTHNIRDYSEDKNRRVDDTPYGGGKGMLMAAPPIYNCYSAIVEEPESLPREMIRTVYMTPRGKLLRQEDAKRLSGYGQIIILCGHYEGIDQRIIDGRRDTGVHPRGRRRTALPRRSLGSRVFRGGIADRRSARIPAVHPTARLSRDGSTGSSAQRPPQKHRRLAA